MIPTVDFFGNTISRLMVGGNAFEGHTYMPRTGSSDEMLDFYTADRIIEALFEAERLGYKTFMPLGDDFMLRVIRQYKNEGGKMSWIAQTHPPLRLDINLRMIMNMEPIAIYHQGTTTDCLIEGGREEELHSNLRLIRATGVPVGLSTHVPDTILRSEREGWDVDFYMCCLHNKRKQFRGESTFVSGIRHEYTFDPEDREEMFQVIRQTPKPCIAFKVLSGGHIAKTREQVKAAFIETYENIKASDTAVVGVFQRDKNELQENAEIVGELFA